MEVDHDGPVKDEELLLTVDSDLLLDELQRLVAKRLGTVVATLSQSFLPSKVDLISLLLHFLNFLIYNKHLLLQFVRLFRRMRNLTKL